MTEHSAQFIQKAELQKLIEEPPRRGYQVMDPTIDQDAIVYSEISSIE